ncbi:MAG: hypothetical protein D3917_03845 [Candidatus Electrothrix sp. AX5]|nr:hypothetical protein [Candidatus Electrothrix sp. AX5]
MKKCISIVLTGCLAAAAATTGFAGESKGENSGQTVENVQFTAPVDVQSCFIGPILNYTYDSDWDWSGWAGYSSAQAGALAEALGSVGAMVGGNVKLSVTRHGNNGSVNEVELTGNMKNGHLAVMYVGASGDADADAVSGAYVDAWANAWANADANADALSWVDLWDFMAGAYGESIAYSSSSSSSSADSFSYAYADSYAESDAKTVAYAESYNESYTSNATSSHVVVKGANIKEFEGTLSMDGYSFSYLRADAIADVLAQSYAATYADVYAHAYVNASASADTYSEVCINIFGWYWCDYNYNYDYDSAYQSAYDYLWSSDKLQAIAAAHASAVVEALAESRLSINLGVQFKNLPGTDDLLTATGNTSAVLQCLSYSHANANALVDVK